MIDGVLLIIDGNIAIWKLNAYHLSNILQVNVPLSTKYQHLRQFHGCHYVPILTTLLSVIFQEAPYQIPCHHSRYKRCQQSKK